MHCTSIAEKVRGMTTSKTQEHTLILKHVNPNAATQKDVNIERAILQHGKCIVPHHITVDQVCPVYTSTLWLANLHTLHGSSNLKLSTSHPFVDALLATAGGLGAVAPYLGDVGAGHRKKIR